MFYYRLLYPFKKINMSNLIINIRFWYWHFQISRGFKTVEWVKNSYHVEKGLKGKCKIQVYKFFNWA